MTFVQTMWMITGIVAIPNIYFAIKNENAHSLFGWLVVILASFTIVF